MEKIAFISHSSFLTGAPICLAELVVELMKHSDCPEIHFGAPAPGKLLQKYDLSEANLFFFARGFGGKELPITEPRIRGRLRKSLARREIDLVVANTLESFQAVRAASDEGIPSIWMIHELLALYRERREMEAIGRSARLANRLIFNSETALKQLPILGGGLEKKARVIYSGIRPPPELEIKKDFRRELGIGPDEVLLGSIGDVCPYKGYESLLEAFSLIVRRVPNVKLVVVGRFPPGFREFHSRLKKSTELSGLRERVLFTGEVTDVRPWLGAFNLLIHPSWRESFGRVVIEAMAWGKPVVVTRSGGGEEIVEDNKTGLLVPVKEPEALARAVLRLLGNPREAEAMGRRGRAMVGEKFSLARTAAGVREEIEKSLRRGLAGGVFREEKC